MTTTFTASDLQNRRRDVMDAARGGRALVRDTDGTTLVMLPAHDVVAHDELLSAARAFLAAQLAVENRATRPIEFGELAWLAVFDDDDRASFLEEFRDTLATGLAGDLAPLHDCVRAWRTTAQALNDPARRAILVGAGNDDYVELDRPQA